jgi:hypothetical protein
MYQHCVSRAVMIVFRIIFQWTHYFHILANQELAQRFQILVGFIDDTIWIETRSHMIYCG